MSSSKAGTGLRHRRKASAGKWVEECDVFVKVETDYADDQTLYGAAVTIITILLCGWLIWSDLTYFFNPSYRFRFMADNSEDGWTGNDRLDINVDMTVAMPCDGIGADVLDSTNQNTFTYGRLREDPAWFQLDRLQRKHFDSIQMFNEYFREEYHLVQDLMWNYGDKAILGPLPDRKFVPDEPHDACRIHGTLALNKVEGNFHVTAGKSIPIFRGHAHLTGYLDASDHNFSHRIDQFSFGQQSHAGIVQPLQGDEKIADKNFINYQYFVQVVPTEIHSLLGTWKTYQYSVKELARDAENSGMPGIYFKYELSALKVIVTQDRQPLWQFLIRLCAGVGGIFATSQIISGLLHFCVCSVTKQQSPAEIRSSPHEPPASAQDHSSAM